MEKIAIFNDSADDTIIKKDDTTLSAIEAVNNVFEQKARKFYDFAVKFYALSEDSEKPKGVKDMSGYDPDLTADKASDIFMKVIYMEEMPSGTYGQSGAQTNFNQVREAADLFMTAVKKMYSDSVDGAFPFKFDHEEQIYAQESGFRKLRYFVPLIFKMSGKVQKIKV